MMGCLRSSGRPFRPLAKFKPKSPRRRLRLRTVTTALTRSSRSTRIRAMRHPMPGLRRSLLPLPYWRGVFEPTFGKHSWEVGTFGLASRVVPMGMSAAGTDSFTDIGVDTQYQYLGDPHTVTVRAAWIHENHNTSASQTLGLADNSRDTLRSLNASISYIYDHTWSLTAGRFSIGGTADATLYGTFTGSPNSAGWTTEIACLPFSEGRPSFWPWLNMRIGLQYVLYTKFDGATTNINGAGRNAHNNNTIFAYAWIMCLQIGSPWLHLRLCRTCGNVGCCDDSPNRPATKAQIAASLREFGFTNPVPV